jgi:hypothetical protein
VTKLPEVLDAVGDFAAHTSVAGVVSLVEKEGCRHIRQLGAKDYELDREVMRYPTKTGRTIGRNMTEDLWVKIGCEMLRATTPNPEAVLSPAVASGEMAGTDAPLAPMPEVSTSGLAATMAEAPLVAAPAATAMGPSSTEAEIPAVPRPEATAAGVLVTEVSVICRGLV